jgi:hypothetical protein
MKTNIKQLLCEVFSDSALNGDSISLHSEKLLSFDKPTHMLLHHDRSEIEFSL